MTLVPNLFIQVGLDEGEEIGRSENSFKMSICHMLVFSDSFTNSATLSKMAQVQQTRGLLRIRIMDSHVRNHALSQRPAAQWQQIEFEIEPSGGNASDVVRRRSKEVS